MERSGKRDAGDPLLSPLPPSAIPHAPLNESQRRRHLRDRGQDSAAICRLDHRPAPLLRSLVGDEALQGGDLLQAGDLDALAVLDDTDELGGLEQAVMGAGVRARHTLVPAVRRGAPRCRDSSGQDR